MGPSGIGPGPRTVLLTGAAGSGVTSTAGALSLVAARSGHKTLLLSADGPARLSAALGVEIGDEPTELEPGLYGLPLGAGPWVRRTWQVVRPALAAAIGDLGVDPSLLTDLARSSLAVSVLRLAHLRACLAEGRWDVVVVDLGATASAFDLLGAPERLRDLVERALPVERRVERAVRAGAAGEDDPLLTGLPNLAAQLEDLRRLVEDANVTSYVVTCPGARPEAVHDAVAAVSLLGQDVAGILVNRMVPAGRDAWQAEQSAAHERILADLRAEYATEHRVVRGLEQLVPHSGGRAAAAVPDALSGRLADLEPLAPRPPRGVRVRRVDGDFELRLALPGVRAGEVDLRRRGDDLLIGLGAAGPVGGCRLGAAGERGRVLRLPSALRRCDVVGARLRDGDFVVTFRPDPRLWSQAW